MTVRYAATPQVSGLRVRDLIAAVCVAAGHWRSRRRYHGRGVITLIPAIAAIARIVTMAVRTGTETHYYQSCGDANCMLFGCRAYKQGWADGYAQGWMEGEAAGFAAGFAAGSASSSGGGS